MASYLGFTLGTETLGSLTAAFAITVAGTTRTTGFDLSEFTITDSLGAPSTLSATVVGFSPSPGQEVRVTNGGSGGRVLFGGHITDASLATVARQTGDRTVWQITCQDYSWLIDRYSRVTARYLGLSYNTIVRRIVDGFTNGGFTTGYCPSSLGTLDAIEFTQEPVRRALERVAEAAQAYLAIGPDKHVHVFASPDHLPANAISLTNASKNFAKLVRQLDYSDIATRVELRGGGTETTEAVSAGATTVPVNECRWFSSSGGTVMAGHQEITYTGVSVSDGPGTITGCSGIVYEIPQNAPVDVFVRVNDSAAQTALATALGGGVSGIAVQYVADGRLTLAEATGRANKILADRKSGTEILTYDTYDELHSAAAVSIPGKSASVDITNPITVSGTFRVQRVTLKPRTAMVGTTIGLVRSIVLGTELRDQGVIRVLTGQGIA